MNIKLLLLGFILHLIFLNAVFDIYFTSPLVHGMTSLNNTYHAPAKRLILFVADGLRADEIFGKWGSGKNVTNFLRKRITDGGSWGISNTRVPTESRPGHVALIAGFYEDVSAITKGWKENPVEFDSLFNKSRYTWSWGSPDILPMFSKGANGKHVYTYMYPGHSEDFAGSDLTQLDKWVFDEVKNFFVNPSTELLQELRQDKIILFLHLLGLDTTGHVHKPHTKKYKESIRVVNKGIEETVRLIEEFYSRDQKTTYIFTSDHGMTDWGSHGAGDPTETMTPVIMWGAGINGPIKLAENENKNLLFDLDEELALYKRHNMEQADLCPLMANLIGIEIPANSVGVIPLDILNTTDELKAHSIFTNLKQIYEQYKIKKQEKETTTFTFLFVPHKLKNSSLDIKEEIEIIDNLIASKQYEKVIIKSKSLIQEVLEGFMYYHRYDRFLLGTSILLSYLGWMAYIFCIIIHEQSDLSDAKNDKPKRSVNISGFKPFNTSMKLLFFVVSTMVVLFLLGQSKPLKYYIYLLIPTFLWYQVLQRYELFICLYRRLKKNKLLKDLFGPFILFSACLELVIFSFNNRRLLSFGFFLIILWTINSKYFSEKKFISIGWMACCGLIGIFPLLPTVGKSSDYNLVYSSAILIIIAFLALEWLNMNSMNDILSNKKRIFLVISQLLMTIGSILLLYDMVSKRNNHINQHVSLYFLSWIVLGVAFFLPMMSSQKLLERIWSIGLSLFSPYLLLSISHEGFFYLSLCSLMLFWILLENKKSIKNLIQTTFEGNILIERKLNFDDIRCSGFFIFFLIASFFGTGNLASINSFDPNAVLCFVSVFNPFVMGMLLLLKILIPFLLISCCFYVIQVSANIPRRSFFLTALFISDFMALHFFFSIQETGSWLEIGTSISHYVIVMSMILFLFMLLSLAKFLTEITLSISKFC